MKYYRCIKDWGSGLPTYCLIKGDLYYILSKTTTMSGSLVSQKNEDFPRCIVWDYEWNEYFIPYVKELNKNTKVL